MCEESFLIDLGLSETIRKVVLPGVVVTEGMK